MGLTVGVGSGCKGKPSVEKSAAVNKGVAKGEGVAAKAEKKPDPEEIIGYDLRRLRPSQEELQPWFEKQLKKAIADGKRPAVLFSASWCHACQDVELELGNQHPRKDIGHVRIFEIIEEDWEAVTRMDEYNDLRARWHPELGTYPMLFLLDQKGDKIESMDEAKIRLKELGKTPNFVTWFADVGPL